MHVGLSPGRAFRWWFLGLIAFGLVVLLGRRAGLTIELVFHTIAVFPAWAFACYLALSAVNLVIGTWKWLLVLRTTTGEAGGQSGFLNALLTTTIGELLGQVMPVQAGIALSRSVAGRFGVGSGARANLGTTVYEQVFDAIVLAGAALTGIVGLALRPPPLGWVVLVALAATCSLVVSLRFTFLARIAVRIIGFCLSRQATWRGKLDALADRAGQFDARVLAKLGLLSLLRYVANLGRVAVLVAGVGLSPYTEPAIIAFPLILVIALIPITPGNLGIMEWSWSAVLVSAGAPISAAGLFAIVARVVSLLAAVLIVAVLVTIRWGYCLFSLRHSREPG